jgi:hypothetical protein
VSLLKSFFWGMGVAAAAYILSPRVKKMAGPMLKKSMEGASALAEKGKGAMEETQGILEKKSDYEPNLKEHQDSFEDTKLEQVSIERDLALNEISELRKVIEKMQEEIRKLKQDM